MQFIFLSGELLQPDVCSAPLTRVRCSPAQLFYRVFSWAYIVIIAVNIIYKGLLLLHVRTILTASCAFSQSCEVEFPPHFLVGVKAVESSA